MQNNKFKGINKSKPPKVYATLPVLNESAYIEALLAGVEAQDYHHWILVVCVNQPDEWWELPEKRPLCEDNAKTLQLLKQHDSDRLLVIDCSSKGNGWQGKRHGVGWARKTAMDFAANLAADEDIILSIDADTHYPAGYFGSVVGQIEHFPQAKGFSAPYYHKLTGDDIADYCILRYEIYMRNYALQMMKIQNPYCFSAIGSGMGCTAKHYKKSGGLTPKLSGEDFYFIQKLRKSGNIIIDNEVVISPAARFSDRVYFGTGPAMIRGRGGDWNSYPIYCSDSFGKVEETFSAFHALYERDVSVPMDAFLHQLCEGESFWENLRKNASTREAFVKACMQRLDGLRVLQFLKSDNENYALSNEEKLFNFLHSDFFSLEEINGLPCFDDFSGCGVHCLSKIRDILFTKERSLQRKIQLA